MKGMKKRGLCLALSFYIVAGSATNSYASASIVIGGGTAVAVEYAFAWLLGAVGLTAASAIVYENADSIKAWGAQQNREFCQWVQANADAYNEWADVTEDKINAWCDRVAKGTIDKGSSVWQAFKDWASSIYVGGGSVSPPVSEGVFVEGLSSHFRDGFYLNGGIPGDLYQALLANSRFDASASFVALNQNTYWSVWQSINAMDISVKYENSVTADYLGVSAISFDWFPGRSYVSYTNHINNKSYLTAYQVSLFGDIPITLGGNPYDISVDAEDDESYSYVGGASDVFDRDGSLDNLDLVGTGSAADVTDVPVVWTGDDALADILAGVAAGTDSWAQVLENAGVVVVDRIGDTVVDDEGVTDEPIAGVVPMPPPSVPSEIKDYTVEGLSDLFPFCLPFDLIDFLGILVAEPEAPNFTWTFSYPSLDGMKTYDFEIDLSPFNSVAQLLRDLECILFVVGLILITRDQMIKG